MYSPFLTQNAANLHYKDQPAIATHIYGNNRRWEPHESCTRPRYENVGSGGVAPIILDVGY